MEIYSMDLKTLIESEEQYKNMFFNQFNIKNDASLAWDIIDKPETYPCIVIKSCGRYTYVYLSDFKKADN
jgi:hypothetical protein